MRLAHDLCRIKMLSFPFLISLCSRDPQAKNTLSLLPTRLQSPIVVTALWVLFPFLTPFAIRSFFPVEPSNSSVSTGKRSSKRFLQVSPLAWSSHLAYWPSSCFVSPSLHLVTYFPREDIPCGFPGSLLWLPIAPKASLNQIFFHFSSHTLLPIYDEHFRDPASRQGTTDGTDQVGTSVLCDISLLSNFALAWWESTHFQRFFKS